jgi:hypothetical protein
MKQPICPSDIKPFTSFKKADGTWYVIIDVTHHWKGNQITQEVENVILMNVKTEEKNPVPAGEFCQWVNSGVLNATKNL